MDLRKPISAETFKALRSALTQHKVLVLRDQDITHEQHKAFGAMFGELEGHPVTTSVPGHPEILVIEAADGLKITDAILPIARPANKWHTDVTFREKPSFAGVCSPSAHMARSRA